MVHFSLLTVVVNFIRSLLLLPKISVVTSVCNAEGTIERTMRSVFNQDYSNFEYIVVDGGSTDKTREIIEPLRHLLAHYSTNDDRGISDGFNRGISRALGEIVILINADDWLAPGALSKVAQFYSENQKPDVIYGNLVEVKNQKERLVVPRSHKLLYEGMVFSHPSTVVRRDLYDKVGLYSLDYNFSMDYQFFLRAYLAGAKFKYIPEVLAYFSAHGWSNLSVYHKIKVHIECYRAQIEQHLNPLIATLFLFKKIPGECVKSFLRR